MRRRQRQWRRREMSKGEAKKFSSLQRAGTDMYGIDKASRTRAWINEKGRRDQTRWHAQQKKLHGLVVAVPRGRKEMQHSKMDKRSYRQGRGP